MTDSNQLAKERTHLAHDRTDWAEDRTVLASMRTFAGWMRTGLACFGIALAIHAIFAKFDPTWLAKLTATVFALAGMVVIVSAYRNAKSVQGEMDAHSVKPLPHARVRLVAGLLLAGGGLLVVVLWAL